MNFKYLFRSGKRSGEATSNTRTQSQARSARRPITHPAYGLFWRKGMSVWRFLRNLPRDIHIYLGRLLTYARTGVPSILTWEFAAGLRDLMEVSLTAYSKSHYGYPGRIPTLSSLSARAANPDAPLDYLTVKTNESAAREEWEKIIRRLLELLYWMDENNEVYNQWVDEVWERVEEGKVDDLVLPKLTLEEQDRLVATYAEIESARVNAKHDFFVILEEVYDDLWD